VGFESADATARNRRKAILRVLLADERREALHGLSRVVESLGHSVMPYAISVPEAAELIERDEPDMACVMVHDDDDHALSLISELVETSDTPVIAVLSSEDPDFIARAIDHGIAAYITGMSPTVVQAALDLARERKRQTEDLNAKVAQLQTALDRRAVIERAKGILMERHSVDARRAFALLRSHARAERVTVVDLAAAVAEKGALLPDAQPAA
jgi:AmiR/NasT family two-component response regulator